MNTFPRPTFEKIKKATAALAVLHEQERPQPSREQPFTILGSGFCVHSRGIVVTCAHVVEAFMEKKIKEYLDSIPEEERSKSVQTIPDVHGFIPHALFYLPKPDLKEVQVFAARVDAAMTKTNMDLGLLRLNPHSGFPEGYPTVDFEDFEHIHEGMEIGICGFPLGNLLFKQLGTVTSSFSRGIVSSIIPTAGASRKDTKAFQLDLRATHGNSGGPVFSWATGQVIGVLQSGLSNGYGRHLFSRAESVYRLLDEGAVDRMLTAQRPPGT